MVDDGHQITQKEVKRFQMVCRARQQHVESTLKAQQLITCMSNILEFSYLHCGTAHAEYYFTNYFRCMEHREKVVEASF